MNFCDICGSNADEKKLIICENCVTGWSSSEDENDDEVEIEEPQNRLKQHEKLRCFGSAHTFCLGFRRVPKGDWYCSECTSARALKVV